MILTGPQIREARIATGMTQAELAKAARVDVALIMRAEAVTGLPMITKRDMDAVSAALKAAGVEFVPENGGGAGVRLRKAMP